MSASRLNHYPSLSSAASVIFASVLIHAAAINSVFENIEKHTS